MNGKSYKFSFICAVTLHVVILLFLLIKFTSSEHHYVANQNIVKASIISSASLNKPSQPAPVIPQKVEPTQPIVPPKPVIQPKPVIPPKPKPVTPDLSKQIEQEKLELTKQQNAKKQAAEALKKHLAAEQARELASLKHEIQTTKKTVAAKAQQKQTELMQKTMEQQLAAERNQMAEARSSQLQGEIDKYKAMIVQAISSHWIIPDGVDNNATCQLLVSVAPGGVVLNVQLISSSGNPLLDRSAQTAVLKASPLPVPEAPELFDEFRTIKLKVRPEGIVTN